MNYKNRGMLLEHLINATVDYCASENLALIHKKEVPIAIRKISESDAKMQGSLKSASTVDYYGVCQGRFIAFEAKATRLDKWALSQIKPHQRRYLEKVQLHGGIAFLVLGFIATNEFYLISVSQLRLINKKSINRDLAKTIGHELELTFPGRFNLCEVLLTKLIN